MTKGVPLRRLYRKGNADIPVILVSAGPSLEKNVEDLKEAKGHVLIWCADAALIPVLGSSNTRTEFLNRNTAKKKCGFDHEQILMMS